MNTNKCPSSPRFLEKSLLKTVPKRSLSPFLQRKIRETSANLCRNPLKCQFSQRVLCEKSAVPYFLPAVFKKDEGFLRKTLEKQMKDLVVSQKNRSFSPNSAKISCFSEKISRLIAKNQQKIDARKEIIAKIVKKIEENSQNCAKPREKSYEICELELKFKKLARKTSPKASKLKEIH